MIKIKVSPIDADSLAVLAAGFAAMAEVAEDRRTRSHETIMERLRGTSTGRWSFAQNPANWPRERGTLADADMAEVEARVHAATGGHDGHPNVAPLCGEGSTAYPPGNMRGHTVAEADEAEANDGTPGDDEIESPEDLDADGLPWDARIHSSSRKTVKATGRWARRRHVPDEEYDRITEELRRTVQVPVAATEAPPVPVAEVQAPPVPAAEVQAPPVPAAEVQAPPVPTAEVQAPPVPTAEVQAPPVPVATDSDAPQTLNALLGLVMPMFDDGRVTLTEVQAIVRSHDVADIGALKDNAHLVPVVWADVQTAVAEKARLGAGHA